MAQISHQLFSHSCKSGWWLSQWLAAMIFAKDQNQGGFALLRSTSMPDEVGKKHHFSIMSCPARTKLRCVFCLFLFPLSLGRKSKYGEGMMYWTEVHLKGSLSILGRTSKTLPWSHVWMQFTSTSCGSVSFLVLKSCYFSPFAICHSPLFVSLFLSVSLFSHSLSLSISLLLFVSTYLLIYPYIHPPIFSSFHLSSLSNYPPI